MDEQKPGPDHESAAAGRPPRIETQIHRRKKAKAFSPLTAEWDARRPDTRPKLRMPSRRMRKSK